MELTTAGNSGVTCENAKCKRKDARLRECLEDWDKEKEAMEKERMEWRKEKAERLKEMEKLQDIIDDQEEVGSHIGLNFIVLTSISEPSGCRYSCGNCASWGATKERRRRRSI